jgi:anti-sigma28 factor (negative regulator of flagellin synthesis)
MRLHLDSAVPKTVESGQTNSISGSASNSGVRGAGSSASKDSVAVSGLSSALNASSGERAARIQSLSAAVANGSYQVSSSAISSAIVGHAIS